jgi:hypothetical protein
MSVLTSYTIIGFFSNAVLPAIPQFTEKVHSSSFLLYKVIFSLFYDTKNI